MATRAKVVEAMTILAIPGREFTADQVSDAYRTAAKLSHPDAGGSAAAFARVDWARHVLLSWLNSYSGIVTPAHAKRGCEACSGTGHTFMASRRPGSKGLRRTCTLCHGSGDTDFDSHKP